jgi:hypothetical protein
MSVFIVFDAIENPLHNTDDDCVVVVSNDALHHLVRVPLARLNLCTTRFQLTHALSMPSQSESVASLLLLRAIADSPHVEAEVSGQRVLIRGLRCGLKQLECVVAEMMLAKNDTSIDSFCRALALLGGRDVAVDSSLLFASVTLQSSANSTKIRVLRSLDKNDDLFVSLFPCHDLNGTHGNKLAKCIDDIMALAARVGAFPSASVLMLFVDSDGVRLASTAHGKLILQAFADVLLQCAEGSIVPKDTGAQFFMALSTSHFAHSSIVRHTLHFLRRQKVVVVGSLQSAVLSLAPNQCVRKWLQPANDITSDAFVGLSIAKPIESVESFVHRVMGLDVALELFPTLRRTFVGDQQIHTAIQIMRAVDFDGKVAVATLMPVCLESADAALKLWRSRVDWCALPLRLECASGGSDSTPLACRAQRHNALQLELSHCRDIDTRVRAVCDADQVATIFERHSHVVAVLPGARRREWSLDLSEPCIVVFVWLKGWMPDGEEALPTRICGLPVDVREASCKPLGGASIRIFAGQDKCVFPAHQ